MALEDRSAGRRTLVVEPTAGDFPHARRRGVRLACCTCTTCCFTLLLGGIGGIAGLVKGIASVNQYALRIENPVAEVVVNSLWYLGVVVAYVLVGVLIGAGIGFAIDMLVSK
jgi:hypothetical protein